MIVRPPSRSDVPRRPVRSPRSSWRRRLSRTDGAQIAFSILATLVVCSLVAGALGTAIFDQQGGAGDADPLEYQEPSTELEDSLRATVAAHPEDVEATALLANLLANTGKVSEAIPLYERLLAANPDDTGRRLEFARVLADGEKHADAELQFAKVLEAEPHNVEALFYRAQLYRTWHPPRIEDAVAGYRDVMEIAPDQYLAQRAAEELAALGYATPGAGATPAVASMEGTP